MRDSRRVLAVALLALGGVSCAYRSVTGPAMCRERSLRSRPFANSRVMAADLEGVAFVSGSDELWIGDDIANQVYVIDHRDGSFRARLRAQDFLAAFPDARDCDSGDPNVECSYTAELEVLAYDDSARALYVMNTVNDLKRVPAVDKPAIYKLARPDEDSNLRFVEWKELLPGHKYGAMVVVDGQLYIAIGARLVAFDYEANRFARIDATGKPLEVYTSPHGTIVGMAWTGADLWLLHQDRTLAKVDWKEWKEVQTWDMGTLGVKFPKGLTFGRAEFFLVDGDPPNPIHVLRFEVPPKMSRAAWLGGWPNSCP